MIGLFARNFDELDENDLKDLVEVRKVREHLQLDYKMQPNSHNHSDTVEMLADVTAMANAQGGYIILGVDEDTTQADGTPKNIVGFPNGDKEAQWIQSLCISSVDERIPGLRVRDIPLGNGLSCVIIQIPNSPRKPHMVVHEKHRSFRMRHGRDKGFMGMQEVRNMILSTNSYRESLADFIDERKRDLSNRVGGRIPWFSFMATPIYVDVDKVNPLRSDIQEYLMKRPGVPDRNYEGVIVLNSRPTLFGIEASVNNPILSAPATLLRLYRNGHLEYFEVQRPSPETDWPNNPVRLFSYRMAVILLHFLRIAKDLMQLAEVNEPIAVTAYWEYFNPSYMPHPRGGTSWPGELFIWKEDSLTINLTAIDLSDPSAAARAIIDRLINAYGYEDNPHFDSNGQFVKK